MSDKLDNITVEEIQQTAEYLLYTCGYAMGGNRSIYEMLGSATAILTAVAQKLQSDINDGKQKAISEKASPERAAIEPGQVQSVREVGGVKESSEGDGEAVTSET